MEQYEAMGSNKHHRLTPGLTYDEAGNSWREDYFPALYDYCLTA